MDDTTYESYLLIASITSAIINGVKHYTKEGILLTTVQDIIEELTLGREIRIDETERIEIVTTEEMLKLL
jgi:hypothetical protein